MVDHRGARAVGGAPRAVVGSESQIDRVRIVLAGGHVVVRADLRMLLDAEEDLEVVAEAGDVASAIRCLRGYRPDVLVLDLNTPGEPSAAAIPSIAEEFAETAIVVLAIHGQPSLAREALRCGARGYVLKDGADGELVESVRIVSRGGTYLTPTLGALLALEPVPAGDPPEGLTTRELEILRLIVLGHTNGDVARQLSLSIRTIESHRARVQRKLGRTTRAELVRYALDHGLIEPGPSR